MGFLQRTDFLFMGVCKALFFSLQMRKGVLDKLCARSSLTVLRGDATLFMRSDELEAAWQFATPILEAWQNAPPPQFPNYAPGTWGPPEADQLIADRFGGWHRP